MHSLFYVNWTAGFVWFLAVCLAKHSQCKTALPVYFTPTRCRFTLSLLLLKNTPCASRFIVRSPRREPRLLLPPALRGSELAWPTLGALRPMYLPSHTHRRRHRARSHRDASTSEAKVGVKKITTDEAKKARSRALPSDACRSFSHKRTTAYFRMDTLYEYFCGYFVWPKWSRLTAIVIHRPQHRANQSLWGLCEVVVRNGAKCNAPRHPCNHFSCPCL